MRYLEPDLFHVRGIAVVPFRTPTSEGAWFSARDISSLWAFMSFGTDGVSTVLRCSASGQQ
jgi:hypothetical protein